MGTTFPALLLSFHLSVGVPLLGHIYITSAIWDLSFRSSPLPLRSAKSFAAREYECVSCGKISTSQMLLLSRCAPCPCFLHQVAPMDGASEWPTRPITEFEFSLNQVKSSEEIIRRKRQVWKQLTMHRMKRQIYISKLTKVDQVNLRSSYAIGTSTT